MRRRKKMWAFGALTLAVETVVLARRRGHLLGLDTVVVCRDGHVFTTWWVPGVSFKALRLGWWRLQRCPVGGHWSLVTPVQVSDVPAEDLELAALRHDVRLP